MSIFSLCRRASWHIGPLENYRSTEVKVWDNL